MDKKGLTKAERVFKIGVILSIILISVTVTYFLLRIFVADQFVVNTFSMYPTIPPGSKVVVNKMLFGPRIYKSLKFEEEGDLNAFRIKGFRGLQREDIVVFNFPFNKKRDRIAFTLNNVYVKRLIGLPGDTVLIESGYYKVEGVDIPLGYIPFQKQLSKGIHSQTIFIPNEVLFPQEAAYNWTKEAFGPLFIPHKGAIIHLSTENYPLYKLLIEGESKKELVIKNGVFFLGGEEIRDYVFKNNYCFVAGDNVFNSTDSRYFGPIPEDYIVGIVKWIRK
jgi:signal peptidase I, bacterial type